MGDDEISQAILDEESLLKLSNDEIFDYPLTVTNFASLAKIVKESKPL